MTYETDLSTEPAETQAPPRFPRAQSDQERPEDSGVSAFKRSQEAVSLTSSRHQGGGKRRTSVEFLKKRSDYLALRAGARAHAPGFLLVRGRRDDGDERIRVGFTATKKLGNAVVRNRVRRRLKEAARAMMPLYAEPGCDYVLIARKGAIARNYADLLDDIKHSLLRLTKTPT